MGPPDHSTGRHPTGNAIEPNRIPRRSDLRTTKRPRGHFDKLSDREKCARNVSVSQCVQGWLLGTSTSSVTGRGSPGKFRSLSLSKGAASEGRWTGAEPSRLLARRCLVLMNGEGMTGIEPA
ncbi:hypothetical protein PLANTIT3_60967 [Plantibacter sp. T3]|nr:hypothetical protein PLANTIT3_60967 [Plantibacter sp. T3]